MCFLCSGVLCCSTKSVSHTKINNSETVSLDETCATWYQKSDALVIRQVPNQKTHHLSLRLDRTSVTAQRSRPCSKRIMDPLKEADRRNGNIPEEPDYDSVQGSEEEEDIYEEVGGPETELDSTTSCSDMSTQTEWTNGWEDMPAQSYPTDYEKYEEDSFEKDSKDSIPLTAEELKLLESRLNWLNRDTSKRWGTREQDQRYSCNIAPSLPHGHHGHHHRHYHRNHRERQDEHEDRGRRVRSVTTDLKFQEEELKVKQLRKELAKISVNCQHHVKRILSEDSQRRKADGKKVTNESRDNRQASKEASGSASPALTSDRGSLRGIKANSRIPRPEVHPQRSSGTTSDNVSSPPEEASAKHSLSPISSSYSANTCSCSCSTCSCSEHGFRPEHGAPHTSPTKENHGAPLPMQTSSSPTSGNTEDWLGTRQGSGVKATSSSSSSSFMPGSFFRAESEEWVFVVSSSLSPDQELWFAQKGDFEEASAPQSRRSQIMLTSQQLLERGRPTCTTIPESEPNTTSSQEATPKRQARKQALKERALQIQEQRSEDTTDEEELDNAAIRARQQRKTRRRKDNQDKQTAGLGKILMVQAEYGQRSKVLGRDALHITAV